MKVGILTFHSAMNFGAVLQCHGLYSSIKELGHEVSVINYQPSYLYTPRPRLGIKNTILHPLRTYRSFPFLRTYSAHYNRFQKFMKKNWAMSPAVTSLLHLRTIVNNYDIIVVGSDQIWNKQHNGKDPIWWGIEGTKCHWITYAASAGDANFTIEEQKNIENTIERFSHISVREQKLKNILESIVPKIPIELVLDPTLLASHSTWERWYTPIIKGDYITVYQARPNDNVFRITQEIGRQLGISKIIVLDNHKNVARLGYKTFPASPSEFISIIHNAKCLVTTSYHGTAFAIITGTPFYTLRLGDGADERVENLLSRINLQGRLIEPLHIPQFAEIDYTKTHKILESLREESFIYLKFSLCTTK